MAHVIIIFFFLKLLFFPLPISAASSPIHPPLPQEQPFPLPPMLQPPTPMMQNTMKPPSPPSQSSAPLQPPLSSSPPLQENRFHPLPPESQQQPEMPQERMNNILEALIGSGDFANWGNLISMADPSLLPFTSTLFVPNNDVFSHFPPITGFDPFLFLYHVVPHRLSFSDLCLFRTNTRLPTLLPTKSILITNASRLNFTIDGARITDPDLYSTDSVSVHGIGGLLDYQIYGASDALVSSFPTAAQSRTPPPSNAVTGAPTAVPSSKGETFRGRFAVFVFLSLALMMMSM